MKHISYIEPMLVRYVFSYGNSQTLCSGFAKTPQEAQDLLDAACREHGVPVAEHQHLGPEDL